MDWIIFVSVGVFCVFLFFVIKQIFVDPIKAAKKIDPNVRTLTEAEHVLKKDIAQNVSKNGNQVYCKNCGRLIDDDSQFCKFCGKNQ